MSGSGITNVLIREWLNAGLVALLGLVLVAVAINLFRVRRAIGKGWTAEPGIAMACVFWWVVAAVFMRSATVWLSLKITAGQVATPRAELAADLGYIISAVILIVASWRCLYLMDRRHHHLWLLSALIAVAFVATAGLF